MRRAAAGVAALTLLLAPTHALAQGSESCQPADLSLLSGWSGVWLLEGAEAGINGRELPGRPPNFTAFPMLGLNAPWNVHGWERMERYARQPDGTGPQGGMGFPLMMGGPAPFTIVVAPEQTVIIGEYRDVRYIFTDGRGHLPDDQRWGTLWGDSTGCWEGDTLTVETVSVQFSLDYNMAAPPLTENARFYERMRLAAPGRIEYEITVEDPDTLEHPWTERMAFVKHAAVDRLVHEGDIDSGNRIVVDAEGLTIAPPPAAEEAPLREFARLSTAELDRVTGSYAFDGVPLGLEVERRGDIVFYKVEPAQPFFLPMRPSDPLHFFSRMHGGLFEFITDGEGRVTGFTGKSPDGEPISGKRKPG